LTSQTSRKAIKVGKLLDPIKIVAQVLIYSFFIGNIPTHSEIKLANSYLYDKSMCLFTWKLFLPEEEFSLDHPGCQPSRPGQGWPTILKLLRPTFTVTPQTKACAEDVAIWVKKFILFRCHNFSY
ncbi:unnamed protein product, partial [Linum tenue]